MDIYLLILSMNTYVLVLSGYALLVLLIAYIVWDEIRRSSRNRLSFKNIMADEKPNPVQGPSPGDSPAYYTGDPSNDVLEIESLDLVPNPPAT